LRLGSPDSLLNFMHSISVERDRSSIELFKDHEEL
jgi:hypothetical protein